MLKYKAKGEIYMENYIIKSKARKQLKERMGLAVGTILLSTILLNIINVTLNISEDKFIVFSLFFVIGYLFISAPIEAGRCKFLLNMVQGKEEPKTMDLFSQFHIFIKVFLMGIIKFTMQSVFLLIPVLMILLKSPSFFEGISEGYLSIGYITLISVISLVISVVVLIIQIMYSQVNYILVENSEMNPIKCMKESRKVMKGYKFKFFRLQLSFIGWWLLSGLTLGILALWVNPYAMLANTNFYEQLKTEIA